MTIDPGYWHSNYWPAEYWQDEYWPAGVLPLDPLDVRVRKLVSLASGLDSKYVIPGNDSKPAPNVPYATVLEIAQKGSGIDSEVATAGPSETQTTLEQSGRRIITFSVQFYKDGAAEFAEGLLSYASTTPGQIWLAQNGLTWSIAGDIISLDAVMGSRFEQRRAVDITFRYQSQRQIDINRIGSVEIDFSLSAESELTETVEVTDA